MVVIKEACSALRGFCNGKGKSVTNERKWDLAKNELAPKSLRDFPLCGIESILLNALL